MDFDKVLNQLSKLQKSLFKVLIDSGIVGELGYLAFAQRYAAKHCAHVTAEVRFRQTGAAAHFRKLLTVRANTSACVPFTYSLVAK